MDFEEFLWAMGVNHDLISSAKESVRNGTDIDRYYHKMLTDLFRRYLVVGGMPAAVRAYSETDDYSEAVKRLDEIVDIIRLDAGRYSSKSDVKRIQACLRSIPSQLAGVTGRSNISISRRRKAHACANTSQHWNGWRMQA